MHPSPSSGPFGILELTPRQMNSRVLLASINVTNPYAPFKLDDDCCLLLFYSIFFGAHADPLPSRTLKLYHPIPYLDRAARSAFPNWRLELDPLE